MGIYLQPHNCLGLPSQKPSYDFNFLGNLNNLLILELLHKVQILWVGQKNLKKSPNLFWNYILGNVKTKWEIFSIFCGLLKTSELNHQLHFRSSFSMLNFWSCLIEHVTYLKSRKNNVVTSLEMLKKTSTLGGVKSAFKDPSFAQGSVIFAHLMCHVPE